MLLSPVAYLTGLLRGREQVPTIAAGGYVSDEHPASLDFGPALSQQVFRATAHPATTRREAASPSGTGLTAFDVVQYDTSDCEKVLLRSKVALNRAHACKIRRVGLACCASAIGETDPTRRLAPRPAVQYGRPFLMSTGGEWKDWPVKHKNRPVHSTM